MQTTTKKPSLNSLDRVLGAAQGGLAHGTTRVCMMSKQAAGSVVCEQEQGGVSRSKVGGHRSMCGDGG